MIAILAATCTSDAVAQPPGGWGGPERLSIDLVLERPTLVPGDQLGLAIVMNIEDQWHVNPGEETGETGEFYIPTTLTLTGPEGWTLGATQWPTSHVSMIGTDAIALYEGRAPAFVSVTVPADTAPGTYEFKASLGYQACNESGMCEAPTSTETTLSVNVVSPGSDVGTPADASLFSDYQRDFVATTPVAQKKKTSDLRFDRKVMHMWIIHFIVWISMLWMVLKTIGITQRNGVRLAVAILGVGVMVGWTPITMSYVRPAKVNWQMYDADAFEAARADKIVVVKFTASWCINCDVLEKTVHASDDVRAILHSPDLAIFKHDLSGDNVVGWGELEKLGGGGIPVTAIYHPGVEEPTVLRSFYTKKALLDAIESAGEITASTGIDLDVFGKQFTIDDGAYIILFSLAGIAGFLLNLTPCVLPVIPLKILSLQAHAKDPRQCFILGSVFGVGIIAAFAILGILIAGVRVIDWGEMFKWWWVNGLLGLIIFGMGLGMVGLFQIRLPQFVYMFNPQSDSLTGSFLMGIFVAILSTPCTGPLIGAMIAGLLTLAPWIGLTTFIAMGVGMALPYVLLTAKPSLLDRLPRTGPGSALIKQIMGLLMIAVAVWFVGIGANTLADKMAAVDTTTEETTTTTDGDDEDSSAG